MIVYPYKGKDRTLRFNPLAVGFTVESITDCCVLFVRDDFVLKVKHHILEEGKPGVMMAKLNIKSSAAFFIEAHPLSQKAFENMLDAIKRKYISVVGG
jgi:hypothetical protein